MRSISNSRYCCGAPTKVRPGAKPNVRLTGNATTGPNVSFELTAEDYGAQLDHDCEAVIQQRLLKIAERIDFGKIDWRPNETMPEDHYAY